MEGREGKGGSKKSRKERERGEKVLRKTLLWEERTRESIV